MSSADQRKTVAARCPHCRLIVDMQVQGQWSANYHPQDGLPEDWCAAQCPSCMGAALYVYEFIDKQSFPPDGWDGPHQMYPARRRLSTAVPRPLRNDHAEARGCIESGHYTAAAVMARRIVEGIAQHSGYKKGDLFTRLKSMKQDGVIDERLYDWADICRDVGNEGAHAGVTSVTKVDATEAVDFAEAMLDYLFVIRARYDEFKKRRDRAKRKAKSKSK